MPYELKNRTLNLVRKNPLFVAVMTFFVVLSLVLIASELIDELRTTDRQDHLQPFYTPPDPLPDGRPGDIIRTEPLEADLPEGTQGYRILYLSERADGAPVAASGMVFFPSSQSPPASRPVVAWAHPTLGMGRQCAPSRMENPVSEMSWLKDIIGRGWVVTATDYAGLGTPGTQHYLGGRDEARDVINSVRAALQIEESRAAPYYAAWGHSQGGHAVLFTALETRGYAPELSLVAAAAVAPAAELATLFTEQYRSDAGWVMGPEVLKSWPSFYPELSTGDVATETGLKRYEELAESCLAGAVDEEFLRDTLKEDFFKTDSIGLPAWFDAASLETPAAVTTVPLLIAQGFDDRIVLPDTTALYARRSCEAGANLTLLWLGGTGHMAAAQVAGPAVVNWLDDRFRQAPAMSFCDKPLPVKPAAEPPAPPP